jgi:uncharacterized protein YcsI (UPF0317 family)
LVILPKEYAQEFKEYCEKNPRPCPLVEYIEDSYEAK